MAAMAALAGRTRRLRFGMNVVSLALRDPVLLAKQCATIDVLSEGRLLPAFGIGSPLGPEWAALDIDTKTRGRRTDEALEIIARLWREDSVDFAGKHYRLKGAVDLAQAGAARPADVDRRLVGGRDPAHGALRHRLAGRRREPADVGTVVAAIKKAAGRGRPHASTRTTTARLPLLFRQSGRRRPVGAPWRPTASAPAAIPRGYFADRRRRHVILDRVAEYVAVGVEKFILRPVGPDGDAVIAQTRKLIEKVLPQVDARWPKKAKAA